MSKKHCVDGGKITETEYGIQCSSIITIIRVLSVYIDVSNYVQLFVLFSLTPVCQERFAYSGSPIQNERSIASFLKKNRSACRFYEFILSRDVSTLGGGALPE